VSVKARSSSGSKRKSRLEAAFSFSRRGGYTRSAKGGGRMIRHGGGLPDISGCAVGMDLGGHKIFAARVADGVVEESLEEATAPGRALEDVTDQIRNLADRLAREMSPWGWGFRACWIWSGSTPSSRRTFPDGGGASAASSRGETRALCRSGERCQLLRFGRGVGRRGPGAFGLCGVHAGNGHRRRHRPGGTPAFGKQRYGG
jgi:hypothetical protein